MKIKEINKIAKNSENYDEFYINANSLIREHLTVYTEYDISSFAHDIWEEYVLSHQNI